MSWDGINPVIDIPSQLMTKTSGPVAVTTVYNVPDDGRKERPKHVELLTPNNEYKKSCVSLQGRIKLFGAPRQ